MSVSAQPSAASGAAPRGRARPGLAPGAARRLAAVLAAASVLLAWALAPLAPALAAASVPPSASLEWSGGNRVYYGNYNTPIFTSTDAAGKVSFAYCVDATTPPPDPGRYATIPVEEFNPGWARLIRAAMWFSWGGPGFDRSMWPDAWHDGSAMGAASYYAASHLILSYATTQNMGYVYYNAGSSFISYAAGSFLGVALDGSTANPSSTMFQMFARASEVPDDYVCYYLACGQWDYAQYVIAQDYYEFPPEQGSLEVVKASACPGVTDGNACYSLEGALFGVYADEECRSLAATMEAGPDGRARADGLDPGVYWVREERAPAGYALDPAPRRAEVPDGAAVTVEMADEPQGVPLAVAVRKADALTGAQSPDGGSLAGALFEVRFYAGAYGADSLPASPARSWVLSTDEAGEAALGEASLVSGDELYRDSSGRAFLPLGTVAVREVRAPAGYELSDPSAHVAQVTPQGAGVALARYDAPVVADLPERGGVSVQKADAETGRPEAQGSASLAGAEFTVYPLDGDAVGEAAAVIVTDASGFASTAADALPAGRYRVSETKAPQGYLPSAASWDVQVEAGRVAAVGAGAAAEAAPGAGAGPAVLAASRGAGASPLAAVLALVGPRTALADDGGAAVREQVVRGGLLVRKVDAETGRAAPQGDAALEGALFTVTNASAGPVLVGGTLFEPGETVMTIATGADGVASTGPRDLPYGTYQVRESQAPAGYLPSDEVWVVEVREDGRMVEAGAARAAVEAPEAASSGPLDVLAGLFAPAEARAGEADGAGAPTVPEQVVRGGLSLQKVDAETGEAAPQGSASLEGARFAVVSACEGPVVVAGRECAPGEVAAYLVTDAAGRASTGPRDLPFGSYVVYEAAAPEGYVADGSFRQEVEVAEEGVVVPCPAPFPNRPARGDVSGVKVEDGSSEPMAGVAFLVTSLTTGESHVLVADAEGRFSTASAPHSLRTNASDAALGADGTVADESLLSSEHGVWFSGAGAGAVPDDALGALPFDAYRFDELRTSACFGHELVSFEVAVREDGSTVETGEVGDRPIRLKTSARLRSTGADEGPADEDAAILDAVEYGNLEPGRSYELRAWVVNRDTGEALAGGEEGPAASAGFVPEEPDGTVELEVAVDASRLGGVRAVVLERLYLDGVEVASHADPADDAQTVRFAELSTAASPGTGAGWPAPAAPGSAVVDEVAYRGLEPGRAYTVEGVVVDARTGAPLVGADGAEARSSVEFVPEGRDGTVEAVFRIDASNLAGVQGVVFERLLRDGEEVASHADLGDRLQACSWAEPQVPVTGDGSRTRAEAPLALLGLSLAAAGGLALRRMAVTDKRLERGR